MRQCRRTAAAGQDEFFERAKRVVELFDQFFDACDVRDTDAFGSRQAEFAAKVEEVVLNPEQCVANGVRNLFAEQHAKAGVELIDFADDFHPQVVLAHARAVTEAGCARIARARYYF